MMNDTNCWYKDACDYVDEGCEKHCIRYIEMKYLMEHSNLPKVKQQPIDLYPQDCDRKAFTRLREIKDTIVDFVSSGSSLYLCSRTTGNGKTSWAIKLMHKYFDQIWAGNGLRTRALFIHVPTFLMKCKDFKNNDVEFEELKRMINIVDLVIWDEIDTRDLSNYDYSQLLVSINVRNLNNLANIYTGGVVTRDEMNRVLGAKITSRIWTSGTEIIEFFGGDRR